MDTGRPWGVQPSRDDAVDHFSWETHLGVSDGGFSVGAPARSKPERFVSSRPYESQWISQARMPIVETPRTIAFHGTLTEWIVAHSADVSARAAMESAPLHDLMLTYVNHASRFVAPRPRRIEYGPAFNPADTNGHDHAIADVLAEIGTGQDLTPRLSERIWTHAYSSNNFDQRRQRVRRWEDKDFVLNAYGFHHLHLGEPARDRVQRSHAVLLVEFTPTCATIAALSAHKRFFERDVAQAAALLNAARGRVLRGVTPDTSHETHKLPVHGLCTITNLHGAAVMGASITTSGHGMRAREHTDNVLTNLRFVDERLDDPAYVTRLFASASVPPPVEPSFEWGMHYTDLVLVEHETRSRIRIVKGIS